MLNFFSSGLSAVPAESTKQIFEDAIRSERVAILVRKVQEGQTDCKKQLPGITWQAAFRNGHRCNENAIPTGLFMLDIDHIEVGEVLPRVMAMKDNAYALFRIYVIHTTVSGHGLRIVASCEFPTIEENQAELASLLKVDYDKSTKDMARLSFLVPESYFHYIDPEVFDVMERHVAEAMKQQDDEIPTLEAEEVKPSEEVIEVKAEVVETKADESLMYMGIPYQDILRRTLEMFYDGQAPKEGNRNSHTYELACLLAPICDYEPERLKKIIPIYDGLPVKEWNEAISNGCKQPRKGVSYRMKQVLKALRSERQLSLTGGTATMPPMLPERLPRTLELLSSRVPDLYKPAVCEAVFASLAVHMKGVKVEYIDNTEKEFTFMGLLIGKQSVGKSCIKKPISEIMADIVASDEVSRQKEAEYKLRNPANSRKAREPRPADICIQFLADNLTDAAFNQRMLDAYRHNGRYLYSLYDEAERMTGVTSSGKKAELFGMVRNAYDNAPHGQDRVSADSVTGVAPLRWNFNASTTPFNAQKFFASAVNDGTLSRLSLSTIIAPRDMDFPVYGRYDDAFRGKLKPIIDSLNAAGGLIECPQARKLAETLKNEYKQLSDLYDSEAYKTLSYRALVIAYLKAVLLYVTQNYKWTKDIETYVRWSLKYDLWCKMYYFGRQLEDELAKNDNIQHFGMQNLLEQLPDDFTEDDYRNVRMARGMDPNVSSTLRTWKKRGYIEMDEFSRVYHKTEKYKGMKFAA